MVVNFNMKNGICLYESAGDVDVDISKYIFDYKIAIQINKKKLDYKLPGYTRHTLQLSSCNKTQINYHFNKSYPKLNSDIKHIIAFNETIIGDWGIDLMPKWWDIDLAKKYIKSIREANPQAKLWISNHKLINPAFDRIKKRNLLINIAKELELDGVGLQVWLDKKMFFVPGHYLEKLLPKYDFSKLIGDYQNIDIRLSKLQNSKFLDNQAIKVIFNSATSSLISYVKEFGQAVKKEGLLFSVPEWAVFLENQERQYQVAKELLEGYKEVGAEFNCYWYLTDNLPRPQPGKTGNPGLFDKDLKPKKISTLFLK